MDKRILVGIPTYNGADDLLPTCLEAIKMRSCSDIEYTLVVVDDSGRTEHQKKTKAVCDKYGATWLYNERNSGITHSWNTLVRSSNEENIVLLNDDLIVSRGWLEAMVYFLENNPDCGCAGLGFNFINRADVSVLLSGR